MIRLEQVSRKFGERTILTGVSGEIRKGEIFTIIGPSGQGKTTLLRLINMLDTPTEGSIFFDGISLHGSGDQATSLRRRMGMVFQIPASFHETVFENIAIGLKYRRISKDEIKRRVLEKLKEIGLEGYENRKAGTLSGGEMQRVSLARVMVTEPDLLLLDEPTANLDPVSTARIEDLIRLYNRKSGTTVIMSSHDLFQGQRLADRIAVMMEGRFIQTGETIDVFSHPCSAKVARFIGISNILQGRVIGIEDGILSIDVSGTVIHALGTADKEMVSVAIRPEDITLYNEPDGKMSARNVLYGKITGIKPFGIICHVMTTCGEITLAVQVTWQSVKEMNLKEGQEIILSFKAPSVHVMPLDEHETCRSW